MLQCFSCYYRGYLTVETVTAHSCDSSLAGHGLVLSIGDGWDRIHLHHWELPSTTSSVVPDRASAASSESEPTALAQADTDSGSESDTIRLRLGELEVEVLVVLVIVELLPLARGRDMILVLLRLL